MDKQDLLKHIEKEFELIINEKLEDRSKNIILCNLMTRLEENFNYMPIMSPINIPETKEYFEINPQELKIKQLYDRISNERI